MAPKNQIITLLTVLLTGLSIQAARAEEPTPVRAESKPKSKAHTMHYDESTKTWIELPEHNSGTPANNSTTKSTDAPAQSTSFGQTGFGFSGGSVRGHPQYGSFTLSADYAGIPAVVGRESGFFDHVYGRAAGAVDINNDGAGANVRTRLGYNFLVPTQRSSVSPFLGLEPANLDWGSYKAEGMASPSEHFTVSSMMAAGVQLMSDTCQAILSARAGGLLGAGSEGQPVDPAGGIGALAICKGFTVNLDMTWAPVLDKKAGLADISASAAKSLGTSGNGIPFSIGAVVDVRTQGRDGEGFTPGNLFAGDQTDVRAQVTINANWAR